MLSVHFFSPSLDVHKSQFGRRLRKRMPCDDTEYLLAPRNMINEMGFTARSL